MSSLSLRTPGFGSNNNTPSVTTLDPLYKKFLRLKNSFDSSFVTQLYNHSKSSTTSSSLGLGGIGKSSNTTDEQLEQAKADADPDMVPFNFSGFSQIKVRIDAQKTVIDLMNRKINEFLLRIQEIENSNNNLNNIFQQISQNNQIIAEKLPYSNEIDQELLSLSGQQFSIEEHNLLDKLEKLSEEIHKPNKFKSTLNTLLLKSKFLKDNNNNLYLFNNNFNDFNSLNLEDFFKLSNNSLSVLNNNVKKLNKSLNVLEKVLNNKELEI